MKIVIFHSLFHEGKIVYERIFGAFLEENFGRVKRLSLLAILVHMKTYSLIFTIHLVSGSSFSILSNLGVMTTH